MKIKIDHIAKIEGHAGFVADIIKGDVKKARLEIDEGARLIEGILLDRHYEDAPIITSRICGVCPVVHILTAIKALEAALNVTPTKQTVELRKLLMAAQLINSHIAHLFFFSLSDFFGIENDRQLIKKYPDTVKDALKLRDFANKIIEVVGGRTIHPLTPQVGGERRLPKISRLNELLDDCLKLDDIPQQLAMLFTGLKYPPLERDVRYASLIHPNEYAIYEGDIAINGGKTYKITDFISEIKEFQLTDSAIKSTCLDKQTYMVGALARLNNNYKNLHSKAAEVFKESKLKLPADNPFYNILAQAIELIHCFEESKKILNSIIDGGLKDNENITYVAGSGKGLGAIEAPRGTLYHYYEISDKGILKNVNIITPTAQNISRLEDDFIKYLPMLEKLPKKQREDKIKMLIRAYDPCLTCATH